MAKILEHSLAKHPACSNYKWAATLLGQLDDHNDQVDYENEVIPLINLHPDLEASVVVLE